MSYDSANIRTVYLSYDEKEVAKSWRECYACNLTKAGYRYKGILKIDRRLDSKEAYRFIQSTQVTLTPFSGGRTVIQQEQIKDSEEIRKE